ncbi:hypothetical protein [Variovorax sp. YR216]|uniref:hypothetical protein n=1 Tax=Variovorax sp. YR216 TaxID=1882828 RepID=UPI00115FF978
MPAIGGAGAVSVRRQDGNPRSISSTDVNDYLREIAGRDFSAKDFRTWHGTVQAFEWIRVRFACDDVDPIVRPGG